MKIYNFSWVEVDGQLKEFSNGYILENVKTMTIHLTDGTEKKFIRGGIDVIPSSIKLVNGSLILEYL